MSHAAWMPSKGQSASEYAGRAPTISPDPPLHRNLALAYALALAVTLLFPFDFSRPSRDLSNGARWVEGASGVEFRSIGLVRSEENPRRLCEAMVGGTGLTLEAWLATAAIDQVGPARIVSYSRGLDRRNFTLGQVGDALALRLRTTSTGPNGTEPEHRVPGAFRAGELQHFVVTYDYLTEIVYVDGRRASMTDERKGRFDGWDPSYPFLLANETTGTRPWLGRLHLVALYDRPLSDAEVRRNHEAGIARGRRASTDRVQRGLLALYRFSEGEGSRVRDDAEALDSLDLEIPQSFRAGERGFLARSVWSETPASLYDRLLNVAVFIPFGFLVDAAISTRRRRLSAALITLGVGATLTLALEAAQYWLESRESSASDVAHNVVGTGLGLVLRRLHGLAVGGVGGNALRRGGSER